MPYAITALFDAATEERLRAARAALVEAGLCDPAVAEVRPHLSFSILPGLDAEALRPRLRAWCYERAPLALQIAAVGSFPGDEGVVYLAPVVTERLLETNASLDRLLAEAGGAPEGTYRAGSWVPHVTVGIHLASGHIPAALGLLREADVFYTGVLTQLAVAEFPPLTELYTFPLRGEGAASAAG